MFTFQSVLGGWGLGRIGSRGLGFSGFGRLGSGFRLGLGMLLVSAVARKTLPGQAPHLLT